VIYADQRWVRTDGIGRFARNVLASLQYQPIHLNSNPAAPLDTWLLARALKQLERTDVFFSPGYNTPLFCAAPFVFTIHDLTHICCPEAKDAKVQLYYAIIMKRACRRSARILTVSEFSKKQIIDWSGVSPQKVVNVSNGVDSAYRPDGDSYGFPFPYLLAVSNRKPHKNELRIVEAFAKANLDSRMYLVFTGQPTLELSRCIEAQGVDARVEFIGVVPEGTLPSLYRGAKALIFPSLYEGFGLPILEAMACGTPVVTSNVTAMPETAGNAALFVDPRSVEQISAAMHKIVNDLSLCQELRQKGLLRVASFSWETTRARVCQVLRDETMRTTSM
jgi:glycosyltransferase involved in cell wall biosynthesis